MLNYPGVPGTPVAGGADVALNIRVSFGINPGTYSINGVTFSAPTVPVLLQILSGARRANELLPKGSVYELPPNKVVELSLPGGAPGSPVSRCRLCLAQFAHILTFRLSTLSIYME